MNIDIIKLLTGFFALAGLAAGAASVVAATSPVAAGAAFADFFFVAVLGCSTGAYLQCKNVIPQQGRLVSPSVQEAAIPAHATHIGHPHR